MNLVTCLYEGKEQVGLLTSRTEGTRLETRVVFLPYPDMNALIEAVSGDPKAKDLLEEYYCHPGVPLEDVKLLAPIPRPRQDVICLGMNYREHKAEAAQYDAEAFTVDRPAAVYFSKRVTEALPPEDDIPRYEGLVERLDYEVELAVIIGKTAKNVKAADVEDYIFGYTILNDVSARDLQTGHKQWYRGKSLDGFTPMGPWIAVNPSDKGRAAIPFPPALEITCKVNGELRQKSNTSLLIHSIAEVIEELSDGMTLLPGTIIATGTPAGVGLGFDPPDFLESGDVVECAIEGLGTLRNTVR